VVVVATELRRKNEFHPFHADLATAMPRVGFLLDDIIIWDRRHGYNYLRPLGYPAVFRVNKAHEFVMILQKPRRPATSSPARSGPSRPGR
jgi:hypothetical protein